MDLSTLKPSPGSKRRARRVGRGIGSGSGKTCGRGHKGRGSRAGGNTPPSYEGGQMPLQRRIPKRGFRRLQKAQARREEFEVINIGRLASLGVEMIDAEMIIGHGLVRPGCKVKVLGDGELNARITVRAHAFSAGARRKIEAAGGAAELMADPEPAGDGERPNA